MSESVEQSAGVWLFVSCLDCTEPRPAKPRYRFVSATRDGLYYFVNVNSSGLNREHYAIRSVDFWGCADDAVIELRMAADRFAAEDHPLLDRAAEKLRGRADDLTDGRL